MAKARLKWFEMLGPALMQLPDASSQTNRKIEQGIPFCNYIDLAACRREQKRPIFFPLKLRNRWNEACDAPPGIQKGLRNQGSLPP